ncbi:type II toxin-antitoxin system VapC family toxin [Altericista sp. CCNU0014]|uniref:type II toxin-antitoxin system VapC family toxin n=1 Tax=Altericista sp. CCNU0014 TaxID=3082949 RepID=UPI00384BB009
MIVDTSAVMAIALQEPHWETLYQQAIEAPELLMSCGTLQELTIVALRKGLLTEVEALLAHLDLDYVPVDRTLALKGLELYQRYGKGGGHPAQLNYGDCFAAAAATIHKMPLLYAGKDFQAAGF